MTTTQTPTTLQARVLRRLYRDSVALMSIASTTEKRDGIERAGAVMATPANLQLLGEAGMLPDGLDAGPDDLVLVVRGADENDVASALESAEAGLTSTESSERREERRPGTIAEGLAAAGQEHPATVAAVSVPGTYAPIVAEQAIRSGLHVLCFSDNVAVDDEVRLKSMAAKERLLMMGPDCGTAILDGVPLAFANVVRPGSAGIVAASGTGAQEVSCLLDDAGVGVSQLIGVGGRDLSAEVGGIMTMVGLDFLTDDADTRVVVVLSKPPSAEVAARVLDRLESIAADGRPVVAGFLGMDDRDPSPQTAGVHVRGTLEGAALAAAALAGHPFVIPDADPPHGAGGGILGLFAGGTLASEASFLLRKEGIDARILDLGDDQYTAGKPHPMIDPAARADRLAGAGEDPTIGIVLLDVVLGHGASRDPATPVADAARTARAAAASQGRRLDVIGSVCGTRQDPQNIGAQIEILREAGITVAATNAAATRTAIAAVKEAA